MQIKLPGNRPHELRLSYVTEAPAWKPSYRVVLRDDKTVDLVGWAIVDNTSGEDWKNVRLGVGASSALSFRFDLRSVRVVERETLESNDLFAQAPPMGQATYGGPPVVTKKVLGDLGEDAIPDDAAAEAANTPSPETGRGVAQPASAPGRGLAGLTEFEGGAGGYAARGRVDGGADRASPRGATAEAERGRRDRAQREVRERADPRRGLRGADRRRQAGRVARAGEPRPREAGARRHRPQPRHRRGQGAGDRPCRRRADRRGPRRAAREGGKGRGAGGRGRAAIPSGRRTSSRPRR